MEVRRGEWEPVGVRIRELDGFGGDRKAHTHRHSRVSRGSWVSWEPSGALEHRMMSHRLSEPLHIHSCMHGTDKWCQAQSWLLGIHGEQNTTFPPQSGEHAGVQRGQVLS